MRAGSHLRGKARLAVWIFLISCASSACLVSSADAKAAHCFTTDEGHYPCEFQTTGTDGSFEIEAPDKPTFVVTVTEPGVANGFVDFGPRAIALPGRYIRNKADPACWVSDSTATQICVR